MRKTSGESACSLSERTSKGGARREQGARKANRKACGSRAARRRRRSRRSSRRRTATRSPCSACTRSTAGWSRAPSSTARPSSRRSRSPTSPRARSSGATTPASSRGRSSIRKRQPLKYRARNAGGEWWVADPYSLRAGARADGRLLHPRGHRTCGSSTRWARTRSATRAPTACTSRSGRRTPAGSASSATSTPGTAAATHAAAPRHRHLGDLHPLGRAGPPLQVRDHRPRRRPAAAEGRSLRPRLGAPAGHRLGRRARARPRLGRRGAPRLLERCRRAPRSRSRSTRSIPGSWQRADGRRLPELGRARRPADPLRRRHGLHPHRVHADLRAPLRPVLGLPDHRPLCADRALRPAGGLRALRRRRPPRPGSA